MFFWGPTAQNSRQFFAAGFSQLKNHVEGLRVQVSSKPRTDAAGAMVFPWEKPVDNSLPAGQSGCRATARKEEAVKKNSSRI